MNSRRFLNKQFRKRDEFCNKSAIKKWLTMLQFVFTASDTFSSSHTFSWRHTFSSHFFSFFFLWQGADRRHTRFREHFILITIYAYLLVYYKFCLFVTNFICLLQFLYLFITHFICLLICWRHIDGSLILAIFAVFRILTEGNNCNVLCIMAVCLYLTRFVKRWFGFH